MQKITHLMLLLLGFQIAQAQVAFRTHTVTSGFTGTMTALAGDFDNDGDLDVVGGAYNANKVSWFEKQDSLNFVEHIISDTFIGVRVVYPYDIDNDGDLDIAGASYTLGRIHWWENDSNGNFIEHTVDSILTKAHSVVVSDFDSDGDNDIIACAYDAGGFFWYENDGSQNFSRHPIASIGPATYVQLFDVDLDGDADILGTQYSSSGNIIYFERTDSISFTNHKLSYPYAHWSDCVDLDGDEDNDLLGAACGSNISWWENDGTQNFARHSILQSGGISCASCIKSSDIDLDGDIDIVVCAEQSGVVRWFENDGNQSFTNHLIQSNLPGASDINIYDFDEDGDDDILCAVRYAGKIVLIENLYADSNFVKDFDGNIYQPINIGTQTWLKENIKSLHYSDGTPVQNVYAYDNSDSLAKIYGRLYPWDDAMNYSTVEGSQGICPCGWHIPTDAEWQRLGDFLGGANIAGGKMKITGTEHWYSPNTGATNESGFSALGAGEWDSGFQFFHGAAVIWSSTKSGTNKAKYRVLSYDSESLDTYTWLKTLAYSVRCIKDTATVSNVQGMIQIPKDYKLFQNYPNPFNPSTTIEYQIPESCLVKIRLFDVLGSEISTLVNEEKPVGSFNLEFNATKLPGGVYFYKLTAGNFSQTKKMLLLK